MSILLDAPAPLKCGYVADHHLDETPSAKGERGGEGRGASEDYHLAMTTTTTWSDTGSHRPTSFFSSGRGRETRKEGGGGREGEKTFF